MKTASTIQWGHLEVCDVAIPEPASGQCRIKVLRAGICGSDVHIYQGHHPTARAPVTQGHEFVGVIDKLGPNPLTPLDLGQRVVVEPLISCNQCEACRRGYPHVCRNLKLLGIHTDGAFAQYVLVDAEKMIVVPENLDDNVAALTEPFAVGVHVCRRGGLAAGDRALVVGAGPIGLIIAIVARHAGARVALCEINPERIAQAKQLDFHVIVGGDHAANLAQEHTAGDGFDVVFEASGSPPGTLLATEVCRVRGTVVQVGFFGQRPEVDLMKLIFKELGLVGSRVYTFEDFRRAVAMLDELACHDSDKILRLISETISLEHVEAGIGRMARGEVLGKILIDPQTSSAW